MVIIEYNQALNISVRIRADAGAPYAEEKDISFRYHTAQSGHTQTGNKDSQCNLEISYNGDDLIREIHTSHDSDITDSRVFECGLRKRPIHVNHFCCLFKLLP